METKICRKCDTDKSVEEFNFKNKSKQIRQSICRSCHNDYLKTHYKNNKSKYVKKAVQWKKQKRKDNVDFIYECLKTKQCVDCGEKNPILLEFDHIDSKTKIGNLSDMSTEGYSFTALQQEMDKCEVRCANCHRMKTAKDHNWRIYTLYRNDQ